jgi:hypothetical protein
MYTVIIYWRLLKQSSISHAAMAFLCPGSEVGWHTSLPARDLKKEKNNILGALKATKRDNYPTFSAACCLILASECQHVLSVLFWKT